MATGTTTTAPAISPGARPRRASTTSSPIRRAACRRAAREANLTAGYVRLYVGCCDGSTIYKVSVARATCWLYWRVRYDPRRREVTDCECGTWAERRVCPHAGAVYAAVSTR